MTYAEMMAASVGGSRRTARVRLTPRAWSGSTSTRPFGWVDVDNRSKAGKHVVFWDSGGRSRHSLTDLELDSS